MCIYKNIQKELKNAMLSKNELIKNCIRSIKSKLTEYEVKCGNRERNEMPNDSIMIKIISSYKKSLEKAIKQMELGGIDSHELIDQYNMEIEICNKFLPDDSAVVKNIEKIVDEAIKNVGSNMGKIMGYVMKNDRLLDGSLVREVVERKLSGTK